MKKNKTSELSKEGFDFNQGIPGKYSILKVFHDKLKMRSLLEGEVSRPTCVRFKPTNRCNHTCFYCVYEASFSSIHPTLRRADELSRKKVMEVLDNLKDLGTKAITYSGGGEPLVHPNINEAFRKTLDYKIGLSIITNGLSLSGEGAELLANADWVRISIDYSNAKMLRKIRKKDKQSFDQTAKNLVNFAKIKKPKCDFEANCVIHEHNFDKIYDIALFTKEHGIENIRFAPCWFPESEKYHEKLKDKVLEQIAKAKELADDHFSIGSTYVKYHLVNADASKRPSRCYWTQVVPVIAADGNVYACHNKAYDPQGIVGSIKNQSFKEMWFSKETAEFFKTFNPKKNCNHECSSHERNVLIGEYLACVNPKYNRYP